MTTATYEARALGVHSGMGLMKAAALAPEAILLSADFEEYRHYSHLFKAAVAEIAPRIKGRGIDEITIDLTNVPGEAIELAQRIKDKVRHDQAGYPSVGIMGHTMAVMISREGSMTLDLTEASDAELVREIYRRIKGDSELHYHRNYVFREALRPIYLFFDKQDIDEANRRMRKCPQWEQLEAARDEVLKYAPGE